MAAIQRMPFSPSLLPDYWVCIGTILRQIGTSVSYSVVHTLKYTCCPVGWLLSLSLLVSRLPQDAVTTPAREGSQLVTAQSQGSDDG
jgi:hypothetical protein